MVLVRQWVQDQGSNFCQTSVDQTAVGQMSVDPAFGLFHHWHQ